MPLEPFKKSVPLTIGVELELQLINLSDFNLTSAAPDLLALLSRKTFPGNVVPEMTESMVEVSTVIHEKYATLLAQLMEMRDALLKAGAMLNVGICGGGTHPFQKWSEQSIFPKPRFMHLSNLYGYLAKQFTIFGQHVHIGCGTGDDALYLLHSLNRYIPQFIALSASSPYVQGNDTLFNSARLNSVFAFPLSGRAPFVTSWDKFVSDYFVKMESTGIVQSMKDFYWDIRPKPEYGTIELRVCDTPLTVERAAALACYLQALCAYLLENRESTTEDDYLVYNYNRFQACRFGLDGFIVHPRTHVQVSIREDILTTLRYVQPCADKLCSMDAIEHLYDICHVGSDTTILRNVFRQHKNLESVVSEALEKFSGREEVML